MNTKVGWSVNWWVILAFVAAILFVSVVWPTQFKYYIIENDCGEWLIRRNRFTGVAEWYSGKFWRDQQEIPYQCP